MEELKLLIEMVAKLPNTALWVLLGHLVYKLSVVGSIYGVIRFVVAKAHDYAVQRKTIPPEVKQVELRPMIDGMCISGQADRLLYQLKRLAGKGLSIETEYIHRQSVDWLREAIDEKIEREAGNGKQI